MRLGICFIAILQLTLYLSCENGTEPTKPITGEYPRNLVWSADTIHTPNSTGTRMSHIWASSPSDVYIGGSVHDVSGKMWHFDGQNWTSIPLHISEGGPVSENFLIKDIYGFSANDVYAVGYSDKSNGKISFLIEVAESLILKYNGSTWTREEIMLDEIGMMSVWGSTPDNIWFGGQNGVICNLHDSNWTIDTLKSSDMSYHQYISIDCISGSDAQNQVLGMYVEPNTQIFNYYQEKWVPANLIEESIHDIWTSPSGTHYLGLHHSWQRWDGNSDPEIIHDLGVRAIYGLSDNDIFFVGIDVNDGGIWKLYHYNGSDVKEITSIADEDTYVKDCWTNGEEVFAVALSYRTHTTKTVIYHGK